MILPLEIINQTYDQMLPSLTNIEEVMDKSTSDGNMSQLLMIDNLSNCDPNQEFNNHNLMTGSGEREEGLFGGIDYYDDNMFSSILNSLIDEDVFANQHF